MNNPKISIIVPVYKAEKYIRKCLDSIIAQTFTDWECILVDDGSPDASGAICDEYAAADSRFKVLHKENEGVSMTRKAGMDTAKGEYSIHVDSDDWIEPRMLEDMYFEIVSQNVDILVSDFIFENNDNTIYHRQKIFDSTSESLANNIILRRLHGSLCNKLLRHACYIKYKPIFFQEVRYCEDELIWCQFAKNKLTVGYIDKAFYHYVWRKSSICNSGDVFSDKLKNIECLLKIGVPKEFVGVRAFDLQIWLLHAQMLTKSRYEYLSSISKYRIIKRKLSFQDKVFFSFAMHGAYELGGSLYQFIAWQKYLIKKLYGNLFLSDRD